MKDVDYTVAYHHRGQDWENIYEMACLGIETARKNNTYSAFKLLQIQSVIDELSRFAHVVKEQAWRKRQEERNA